MNKCKNCKHLKSYYFSDMGCYCDNHNSNSYKNYLNVGSAGCKNFEVKDVKAK